MSVFTRKTAMASSMLLDRFNTNGGKGVSKNIKVETCPQCGAPVKLSTNRCEYCGSEFIVTSLSYLEKFEKKGISNYLNHYKKLLKSDPEDGETNCAIGICYLDLGLYDLATKFFSKAIEQLPDYGDAYYYYALSLIRGRKPRIMTLTEVRKIEEYLNAAIQIDDSKSKYYYLWALIKYDFYMKNCLKVNPPALEELIEKGNSGDYDRQEIEKILERVPVKDEEITRIFWR